MIRFMWEPGEEDNVEFITVELPGVVVHSVYKPPAEQCQQSQSDLYSHYPGRYASNDASFQ